MRANSVGNRDSQYFYAAMVMMFDDDGQRPTR